MFTENDLRQLLGFKAAGPMLSVYLNTDPAEGNADAYRLRLRNMLKEVDLPEDVAAVENFFNQDYRWNGRSVALFSCAVQGFLKAYPLALPVRSQVMVADRPAVKPLADLLDNYGGYGVALVDKQGARLFHFHLGELHEQEGIVGEQVKHTKRGGASTFPGRRGGAAGQTGYEDELVDRNIKDIAAFAVHFFEENHVRRVLISGTDENLAQFRSHLPKTWQSLVMGSFAMSMTASQTEVLAKALQVGAESEHKRELKLVENLVTTAAKGGNAVIGLEPTLDDIHDGRVQVLLAVEGFHHAGSQCPACGWLTSEPVEVCRACSGTMMKIPDVVDLAMQAVFRHGGEVEVVHNNPDLIKAGGMGALLRY